MKPLSPTIFTTPLPSGSRWRKPKVQETTPVYAVVQPATVPIKASKPSKPLILVGCVFLAVVAASAWILFGKDLVANFKKKQ